MQKPLWVFALTLIALIAYLGLWPVPIDAVKWSVNPFAGYKGSHAANTKLSGLTLISLGGETGPEHVVLRDGKLYTAVASGNILRMNPDGSGQEIFANTGGRVLGFDFDAAGNLIAADAMNGLLSISPDRKITVLTDKVDGDPIRFADAVVVAAGSGKMYFSDATRRFAPQQWGVMGAATLDILEHSATGRVLEYDPASRATRIVARGLSFANGIALSRDEKSLFVNETGAFRMWKINSDAVNLDLLAPSPRARVLLDNLPGAPDNLMRGHDGKIWLGLFGPRNPDFEATADKPFLRELVLRLPHALWPKQPVYGHVIAFTEDGTIVEDLQDPEGAYPETTGLTETADRHYVHNLHNGVLGWRPR